MALRFLLDTHVVLRWLADPQKLSREQTRVLREAVRHREPVALSAVSLLEIAVLLGAGSTRVPLPIEDLLEAFRSNPGLQVLPLTIEIAAEIAVLGGRLRDPADRAIVATARLHRLRLLTSDQRIIESKLVSVVE